LFVSVRTHAHNLISGTPSRHFPMSQISSHCNINDPDKARVSLDSPGIAGGEFRLTISIAPGANQTLSGL
ncbi:MAG: hypothetical protein ABSE06_21890, partial [Anaerolineaceae bacterium]